MKRFFVTLIVLMLVFSHAVYAMAAPSEPRAIKSGDTCILTDNSGVSTSMKLDLNPGLALPKSILRANVTVVMQCHIDQSWQNEYGSSAWTEIGSIVDDAEEGILSSFGISFFPFGIGTILTSPANSSSFLSTIRSQPFVYSNNAGDTADIIVGFTAITDGQIAGLTSYNQPYGVILDRGSRNGESLQHEIGHMYGLATTSNGHCPNSCVMTASGWGHINDFCSSCASHWSANAYRYN